MIAFDHIEVHVKNSEKYVFFLKNLFGGGRYKKISENNTYMFLTSDNIHFEIKEREAFSKPFDINSDIGFCLPCLRMKGAYDYLLKIEGIELTTQVHNPDGVCYFFRDYEGIDWHFKDYDIQDIYVNI